MSICCIGNAFEESLYNLDFFYGITQVARLSFSVCNVILWLPFIFPFSYENPPPGFIKVWP